MRRSLPPLLLAAALCLAGPAALAASGSIEDPTGGEFPDIMRLKYANDDNRVVMRMKYTGAQPQTERFYMRFGDGKSYQVVNSEFFDIEVLRFKGTEVKCAGLEVTRNEVQRITKVVVPRSCIPKATNRLRFQGKADEGNQDLVDKTKVSPWVKRG